MLELFPEGFEEVELENDLELAAYTTAGGEERFWQVFGPGRPPEVEPAGRGVEALPPARAHRAALDRPALGGARPGRGPRCHRSRAGPSAPARHPTTRLCLELLLERRAGELSSTSAAARACSRSRPRSSGSHPVVALDVDPEAVAATRANAAANGVEVDVRQADVLADALPGADLAVANITRGRRARVAAPADARKSSSRPGTSCPSARLRRAGKRERAARPRAGRPTVPARP